MLTMQALNQARLRDSPQYGLEIYGLAASQPLHCSAGEFCDNPVGNLPLLCCWDTGWGCAAPSLLKGTCKAGSCTEAAAVRLSWTPLLLGVLLMLPGEEAVASVSSLVRLCWGGSGLSKTLSCRDAAASELLLEACAGDALLPGGPPAGCPKGSPASASAGCSLASSSRLLRDTELHCSCQRQRQGCSIMCCCELCPCLHPSVLKLTIYSTHSRTTMHWKAAGASAGFVSLPKHTAVATLRWRKTLFGA